MTRSTSSRESTSRGAAALSADRPHELISRQKIPCEPQERGGGEQQHSCFGPPIQTGQREAAIEHWRKAVDLDRTNFDALFNLGTELLNAGRNAEARIYLERFVQTAPRAFYWREIEKIRKALG